jgi:peptide/nickel transport system substrate-binding protein
MYRNLFILLLAASLILAGCGETTPVEEQTAEPTLATITPEATSTVPTQATDTLEPAPETPQPTDEVQEPAGPIPLWSTRLKQAIASAIDREAIVDRAFEGYSTAAYHMVPPGYPYFTDPFFDKYGTRDLEGSINILNELGFTADQPFEMELWYPQAEHITDVQRVMELIKSQLEETRLIRVHLQSQTWDEYLSLIDAAEIPAYISGWLPDFVDPQNWLSPFASCESSPQYGVHYCDPEMDDLLALAGSTFDSQTRKDLYHQIGERYAEEIPTIPLYWEPEFIVIRNGIDGLILGPTHEFKYNLLMFTEEARPAAGNRNTIIIGVTEQIETLDPQAATRKLDLEIIHNFGLPLMRYLPGETQPVPGAAADFPTLSEDGLSYIVTLRTDLLFPDGSQVTAEDYLHAWDRLSEAGEGNPNITLRFIDSVEAQDEFTLVFHLSEYYSFFPALIATNAFIPTRPSEVIPTGGTDPIEIFDSIGPYRITAYEPDVELRLEANPDFIGDNPPAIETVIIRFFPDSASLSQAVEEGQIDIAWRTLDLIEIFRLENVQGISIKVNGAPALRYLAFNHHYFIVPATTD